MSTQEPRRGGRARKQIKSYAEEQAAETASLSVGIKRRRKAAARPEDDDNDPSDLENTHKCPARKAPRLVKKASAKDRDQVSRPNKQQKKGESSWLADAAQVRVKRQLATIPMLDPGQQEHRLKE